MLGGLPCPSWRRVPPSPIPRSQDPLHHGKAAHAAWEGDGVCPSSAGFTGSSCECISTTISNTHCLMSMRTTVIWMLRIRCRENGLAVRFRQSRRSCFWLGWPFTSKNCMKTGFLQSVRRPIVFPVQRLGYSIHHRFSPPNCGSRAPTPSRLGEGVPSAIFSFVKTQTLHRVRD